MRKMKIETTIQNLKKMHESYKAEVARYTDELDAISKHLKRYEDLVAQTADAIDALEGRPTIKQQLQQALQTRTEPLGIAVGDAASRGGSLPLPENLPPAEPGFQWVHHIVGDHGGEWVLVPITQNAQTITPNALIELPPIELDEEFGDKPTDFII